MYCSHCGKEVDIPFDAGRVQANSSVLKLRTDRTLLKFILLSIVTFGIYGMIVQSNITTELNIIASRYDGKRTMDNTLVVSLAPITLFILGFYIIIICLIG